MCGKRPEVVPELVPEGPKAEMASFRRQGEAREESGRRDVRKRRRKNTALRIVVGWTALMIFLVVLRNQLSPGEDGTDTRQTVADRMTKGTLADERVVLMQEALPECHQALAGFLQAGSPEARNQFVFDPVGTAGKMAGFYRNNPLPNIDVQSISRTAQALHLVSGEWMVETRWKDAEGHEFDAVFRHYAGTWKLDWSHFARYSDFPWTVFLAGEGPDEGVFRLLGRRRFGGRDEEVRGSRLSIVAYSPSFGRPNELGQESPDFVLDRRSDEGLLLVEAFAAREEGRELWGSPLPAMEQEGLIRMRLVVSREERGGSRTFHLEKIEALHWIDIDEIGFDLEDLQDDLFQD